MRILILSWKDLSHPEAGGAEVYTHEVAHRWVSWGHEVTLFCAGAKGLASQEARDGVQVIRRGGRYTVYREARRYYEREARGRFDVLVDEVNTRPFLCPRWVQDVPVVALIFQVANDVWFHEFPFAIAAVGRLCERRWLRSYQGVQTLTISESSRESLRSFGLESVVVPVGFEKASASSLPLKEPKPTVAFLGRLAANKRPHHALRAFEIVRANFPEAQMWVVGSGPLDASLRRSFASDSVHFFGRVSETQKLDLIARAHVLLVTSVREGWGLVVTEAAAQGTPTIGYDVPGLRESIQASGGVLVEPEITCLAHALSVNLPAWSRGHSPPITPGGVSDWSTAAASVLEHIRAAVPV